MLLWFNEMKGMRFWWSLVYKRRSGYVRGPIDSKTTRYGVVVLTVLKDHWLQRRRIVSEHYLSNKSKEMTVVTRIGPGCQGELPIYVPNSAMLAQKIVEEAHMLTLRGGIGLTMTQVCKRYWIPRLRRIVRKMRRKCHGCKRFTVTAYPTPTTSKLPTTRTQGINPYQVIGVDYAGPIRYRKKRGQTGKAYVLLHACSLTWGIYIDLLPSLELMEFILSLARRGRPDRIYSDNGGTFIGAARRMRIVAREEQIQNFLSVHQITRQYLT